MGAAEARWTGFDDVIEAGARDEFVNRMLCVGSLVVAILSASCSDARCESPYELLWGTDGPILLGTAAIGVGALLLQQNVPPLTADEVTGLSPRAINRFDRRATRHYSRAASTASDWLVYGLIASPLTLLSQSEVRDDADAFLTMYAETLALTGVSAQLIKGLVKRTRPYVYNAHVPTDLKLEPDARKSFYSSHASYAFASAVFLSTTFDEYFPSSAARGFVWGGSLVWAASVGVLRYTSGSHFPTDILVGAVVGSAIGYLIPVAHRTDSGLQSSPGGSASRIGFLFQF